MDTQLLQIGIGLLAANLLVLLVLLFLVLASRGRGAEAALREEARITREEAAGSARELREEIDTRLMSSSEALTRGLTELGGKQFDELQAVVAELRSFRDSTQTQGDYLRDTVQTQLKSIQDSNEARLEQMQHVVDEKLQTTLERRLGESFTLVSQRLEEVQRGLGEMQVLATGVGDLKRVLTNVRVRGTWGEVQLGSILEQILTPDQYSSNVRTKHDSLEVVEFAVKLPGADSSGGAPMWLPIDAKFPQEDYLRLMEAVERGDAESVSRATTSLAQAIRKQGQTICTKYLDPPNTTDFAIMFLPTEGLFAEVIRQPGLVEELQQTCRIVVAGPTTLSALLTSLRMGFRTLAIEQRSGEVLRLLSAVKTEFSKFGKVLEKVKKQLSSASKSLDDTAKRTHAMERALRSVEELPTRQATRLISTADGNDEDVVTAEEDA